MDAILLFSSPFFSQFPTLRIVLLPLLPFLIAYQFILGALSFGGFSIGGLLLFIAIYMLVVRNESLPHFVRFNAMQSILLGIVLSIVGLVLSVFGSALAGNLIGDTLYNVAFLGTVAAAVYSIVQSAMGRYAEIPTISDAVYMQVR
jgi:uncharacterized membrane protein